MRAVVLLTLPFEVANDLNTKVAALQAQHDEALKEAQAAQQRAAMAGPGPKLVAANAKVATLKAAGTKVSIQGVVRALVRLHLSDTTPEQLLKLLNEDNVARGRPRGK